MRASVSTSIRRVWASRHHCARPTPSLSKKQTAKSKSASSRWLRRYRGFILAANVQSAQAELSRFAVLTNRTARADWLARIQKRAGSRMIPALFADRHAGSIAWSTPRIGPRARSRARQSDRWKREWQSAENLARLGRVSHEQLRSQLARAPPGVTCPTQMGNTRTPRLDTTRGNER